MRSKRAMGIGVGCLLGTAACTALSDFSVHQCGLHDDCAHLEGGAWRCQDSRCVPGCASNAHCAATDPGMPICPELGAQCVSLSAPDGVCYANSGYDPVGSGSLTARDMQIVGAFAPTVRSSTWLTLKLAADEINAAGTAPDAAGDSPLVVVLCDDSINGVDPAMDHLVRHLGVRAVVGSLADEPLRVAAERAGTRERALFFSPNGADSSTASSDGVEQLLWYWGAAYDAVAPVYPALVERLVEASSQALTPDAYRIASLVSTDREDQHLAEAVASTLHVGGVDSADLLRFGRLRSYALAPGLQLPSELAIYAPHLLLLFAGGHDPLSPYLDRGRLISGLSRFESQHPGFRPIYVFGPRNDQDPVIEAALRANDELRSRVLQVSADRQIDASWAASLAGRFTAAYPELPGGGATLSASGSVYDALYYVTLALDAARAAGSISASGVRDGLLRITDARGEVARLGPSSWHEARRLLRGSAPLNLLGSSGPAAFDSQSRTRAEPASLRCWDAQLRVLVRAVYDVPTGTLIADQSAACAQGLL